MRTYNINPSKNKTGDCVIRAIALVTGKTWEATLDELVALAKKQHTSPLNKDTYEPYLLSLGYTKQPMPKLEYGKRVRTWQLCERGIKNAVVQQANHLTAIFNNEVVDTWNCEDRIVYNYYTLQK